QLLLDYVKMNQPALARATEALGLPRCRYPVDLSKDSDLPLPHLEDLRTLRGLAEFQALLAIHSGDAEKATRWIIFILRLARTLNEEPVLASQSSRQWMIREATSLLKRRLAAGAPSRTELTELDSAFRAADNTNGLALGLIGERAMAIPVFRMTPGEIERWGAGSGANPASSTITQPTIVDRIARQADVFERDLNYYLTVMSTNLATAKLPSRARLVAADSFARAEKEAVERHLVFASMFLWRP